MDKLLLKPDEVGPLLGCGRSKIYDLIRRGELPSVRLGGQVRVPVEALRSWIREQTENAPEVRND